MGLLLTSIAIALYSVAVNTTLVLPGDNPVPDPVWLAAFLGAFPVFGVGMVFFQRSRRRAHFERQPSTASLPRSARYVVGLACVAMVAGFILNIATAVGPVPPGQPEQVGPTQYVLNNRGVMRPINREEYLRFAEVGQRGFVGIALVFNLVGTLMLAASVPGRSRSRLRASTPTAP